MCPLPDETPARRAEALAHEQQQVAGEAFALLAGHTDDVISRFDAAGRWSYVSPSVYRTLGYLPEELIGRDPFDLIHPDDHDAVRSAVAEMATHAVPVLCRTLRSTGEHIWTETWGRTVPDPQTGLGRLNTVMRDVNARVLADQQLEQFRAVAEQTIDFVGIADVDGRPTWMNAAGRRLVGHTEDEDITGRQMADYLTPEAAQRLVTEVIPACEKDGVWAGETELIDLAGNPIPVAQVFMAHRDHHGRVAYYSTVCRDLRAQREAEREVHTERERYRLLVSQAPGGIFLISATGRLDFVNEHVVEIIGETPSAQWSRRVHPDDVAGVRDSFAAALAAGLPWTREFRVFHVAGGVRWVACSARPMHAADGTVTGYLGTFIDETERREAAEVRAQLAAEHAARTATEAAAAQLGALVDGLAAIVWEADARTGEMEFVSQRMAEVLGYEPDRWVGGPAVDMLSVIHEDDRERVLRTRVGAIAAARDHEMVYRVHTADGRLVWIQDLAHVVTDGDGRALRLQGVLLDVTEQQRAVHAKDVLAQAGRIQSRADPLATRLTALIRAAAPLLADYAVISLHGTDGLLHPSVVAYPQHPEVESGILRSPGNRIPDDLAARCAVGRPFVIETPAELGLRDHAPDSRPASTVLLVPLLGAGHRLLGTLNFVSTDRSRQHPVTDLDLADEIGQRAVLMIESDRVATRERQLHRMTVALAGADGVAAAAEVLTTQVKELVDCAASAVALLDPDQGLRLIHQHGYPPHLADRLCNVPTTDLQPLTDCARTGLAVWLHDDAERAARYPELAAARAESTHQALAVLPLFAADRVLGVLSVSFSEAREFLQDEREFLRTLTVQAAAAFERAELADTRRHVADTLQHSLLPSAMPQLDRIALAARYLSATDGIAAGGDWYDVIELDGDRTAIVVGDVVGHGAPAAAIMGQLRSALAASLLRGDGPAAALDQLDRFVTRVPGARASTALCMIIDTATGELRWCCAGHPAPLLVDATGARYLDGAGRRPLLGLSPAVRGDTAAADGSVTVTPGTTVVLYTDGLVERRGEPADAGSDRLAREAAKLAGTEPARMLPRLLPATLQDTRPQDDVAVIAARLLPRGLQARLAARPEQLGAIRGDVATWAAQCGLSTDLICDLQLALGEAAANSAEHAYAPDAPGELEYRLDRTGDGTVAVSVRDFGTWRPLPADRGFRGRGLDLIRSLAHGVSVDYDDSGTTVRFGVRDATSPGLQPVGPPVLAPPVTPASTRSGRDAAGRLQLEISGDIDSAALHLRTELFRAVEAFDGAGVVIDLRSTSFLSSTGIGLLLEVIERAESAGHAVYLLQAPGSVVDRALTVAAVGRPPPP